MANKTISASSSSWTGTSKRDNVYIDYADSVRVNTGAGNDSIYDSLGWHDTINAGAGNDTVKLYFGNGSSVNAGAGNDRVSLSGGYSYVITVMGGKGNDTVYSNGNSVLHQYALGDGSDVIYKWSANDTLSITGGTYKRSTVGNDVILTVGEGKITLKSAKGETLNIKGTLAGGGKNIDNSTSNKKLTGTKYADTIKNHANYVTMVGGNGNDSIHNWGGHVSVSAGAGKDFIATSTGKDVTVDCGEGNDTVHNWSEGAVIRGGAGNDEVMNGSNVQADYSTVDGGDGDDTISNYSNYSSVFGGKGNDFISNGGYYDCNHSTLKGGAGNDTVSLNSGSGYNVIQYASGDGNDTVYNLGSTDTLSITGAKYTRSTVNNDIVLTVGKGKITLKDAKGKTINIKGTPAGGSSGKVSIPSDALKYNGHSYKLFNNGMTWTEAKAYCESLGGHLVTITDKNEQAKIKNLLSKNGFKKGYWLGGYQNEDGSWNWVTGEKFKYTNFADGEPNNPYYSENRLQIYGTDNQPTGTWDDTNDNLNNSGRGTDEQGFICEWDTVTTGGGTSTVTVPSGDILKGTSGHDNLKNGSNMNQSKDAGKVIYAYAGNDTVTNYADNVSILGGAGNDYITSNYGSNSTVHGDAGADNITVRGNNALVYGDDGNDKIITYNEGNFVYGGKGNDSIRTENNNNGFVSGDAGDDTITAYKGTHLTLSGGAGNDSLWGGANSDTLIGGTGNDIFVYKPGQGTDHITDFSGGDMLQILKTNGNEGGTFTSATFSGGNLTLAISGGGKVILDNVSSGQSININGTNYKISGGTLK